MRFRPTSFTLAAVLVLGTSSATPAATAAQLLACQKTFESQSRAFAKLVGNKVGGCADRVLACTLANEIDAVSPTACLAAATTACAAVPATVTTQKAKRAGTIVTKCGLIPFAEIERFVAGLGFYNVISACSAGNINDLVACVLGDVQCETERHLFRADPRAQQSLTTAGVAASFPCVGP